MLEIAKRFMVFSSVSCRVDPGFVTATLPGQTTARHRAVHRLR
jgi:hypothetical protein